MKPEVRKKVAETLGVLSDETRLKILETLAKKEHYVSELAKKVSSTHSATSHQLRVLRQADLVRAHRRGKRVYYRLSDAHPRYIIELAEQHIREGKYST